MAGLLAALKVHKWNSILGLLLVLLVICKAQDYDYDYDYESYDTESSYYEEYDDYGYYADDDEVGVPCVVSLHCRLAASTCA
jgi:hypothetical protein